MEEKLIQKRYKKVRNFGFLIQAAPFVQGLILTGSMANGDFQKKSDIDFLIIAKSGRLYTARFFVTILAILTGNKRKVNDKNPAGKYCLNYYLTSDFLDILPHNKRCAGFHREIIKVWDRNGMFERLWRRNLWLLDFPRKKPSDEIELVVKKYLPAENKISLRIFAKFWQLLLAGGFGDRVENFLYQFQKNKITKQDLYQKNRKRIILNKNEIRLHPKKD